MTTRTLAVVLTFSCTLGLPSLAVPSPHRTVTVDTYSTIDFPDVQEILATGINDAGTVVGQLLPAGVGADQVAFRSDGMTYSVYEIPVLNEGTFIAWDVNAHEQVLVAGRQTFPVVAKDRTFVVREDDVTEVIFPNAWETEALGMNDQGMIVGVYENRIGETPFLTGPFGFLFDGEEYQTLEVEGLDNAWPWGINNDGQIVGTHEGEDGRRHGFLAQDGNLLADIRFPGASATGVTGINDDGLMVGTASIPGTEPSILPFVFDGDSFTAFMLSGIDSTNARAINNLGHVLGSYEALDGRRVAYIFDVSQLAIPEPCGLALCIIGGLTVLVYRSVGCRRIGIDQRILRRSD